MTVTVTSSGSTIEPTTGTATVTVTVGGSVSLVGGNATQIQGISVDSSVGTPSDGDILVYRSAGSDWVLETKPAGGTLDDVTDVTITAPADNEVLAYDSGSSEWVNQTPAEAGLWQGYTHDQASASASWTVTHNLGRFPSITVVDTSGNRILGFEAVYDSANQVTLTFSAAFSGKAYLN